MENQVNVGDQNTQQIGQNPAIQPVQIPEKPKINYLVIGGETYSNPSAIHI